MRHKTATSDSLAFYFQEANLDTLPYQKRYSYAQKALAIVSKQPNDSMYRVNMFKVANRYFNMNALEDYKKITNNIVSSAEDVKDSTSLGKGYGYLGDYYAEMYVSDSAYRFYNKAEIIFRQLNDVPKITKNLLSKSVLQFSEKDYIGSEISAIEALEFLRTNRDDGLSYEANNLLGIIYNELNEYDKSLEFHNKALLILNNNKLKNPSTCKASSLNNIGLVYMDKKEDKNAIKYFQEALKDPKLYFTNIEGYVVVTNNLGYSQLKMKNFQNLPKLFFEAMKISDSINFSTSEISSKLHLAEYYALIKDTIKAKEFSHDAYSLAKERKLPKEILLSLKTLSDVEPAKTGFYFKEYIKIDDSLQLAERRMRNKFARIEYETEELEIEKEKLMSHRAIISFIGGSLILLLVTALAIRSRRAKNRELKFARQQQDANEEIYRLVLDQQQKIEQGREAEKYRIAQELHDGVMGRLSSIRLNLFVLGRKPDKETIAQCLPYIDQIQEVEKEIRTIAYDLERNPFSGSTSFSAVVGDIVKSIESHSDIDFEVHIDPNIDWEAIDNTVKMELYRILQEALQNTVKHAKAKNVSIKITPAKDGITVEIRDDGIGFDTLSIKKGLGLKGMENRVRKIGGSLQISSQPEKGTLIILDIPLKGFNAITN